MELKLTCAECDTHWVVQRWTPNAMACPHCGCERLGDGRSRMEEDQRIARRKALQRRRALETPAKAPALKPADAAGHQAQAASTSAE